MKIGILQGAFLPVPPIEGGAVEKLWYQLGMQFALLGHEVFHISKRHPRLPQHQIIQNVTHIRVPGYRFSSNLFYLKICDLLYCFMALFVLPNVDILVSNTFWMPLLLCLKPFSRPRIIVSVERMPKGQMFLYRHVDLLRCCSTPVLERVLSEQPNLASKTVMIPNPLPFSFDREYSPHSKKPILLYCGRIHPEKGIDLLVGAFIRACHLGLCGWTLRIVGPSDEAHGGGGSTWLRTLQLKSGSSSHPIEWIGPIYDETRLQEEYRNASVFVYPSLADKGEAMPLAPLEAMAFGTVPIVSTLPCFQDYIVHNVNGLIFDHLSKNPVATLANNFLEISSSDSHRCSLARAASHVRETHGSEVIATMFSEVFKQLHNTGI